MAIKTLRERKYDWFFIAAFSMFALFTLLLDMTGVLTNRLDPRSDYFFERFLYNSYARLADPLLIANTPQVRTSAWISAIIFLPLHIYFVAAFAKGWNKVRLPALLYGGAMVHGMLTYMAEGLYGQVAAEGWKNTALCAGCRQPDKFLYIAANLMYLIIPLLLIFRVRKSDTFGKETE